MNLSFAGCGIGWANWKRSVGRSEVKLKVLDVEATDDSGVDPSLLDEMPFARVKVQCPRYGAQS